MYDDYGENVHMDGGWDESKRKKPKTRSGGSKKKPRKKWPLWFEREHCVDADRKPQMSHSNEWTFGLRRSADDEWDWDDLRTMYGLGPDEEEGDVDTA